MIAVTTTLTPVPVDKRLAAQLTKAASNHRQWEGVRDQLVRQAVAEGGSLREVAALIGLSHAGVKRIVERAK